MAKKKKFKKRLIMQIRKGEYLLNVINGGIETTYNIEDAFDISGWSFEQIGMYRNGLIKAGYNFVKVMEYKPVDAEEVEEIKEEKQETEITEVEEVVETEVKENE